MLAESFGWIGLFFFLCMLYGAAALSKLSRIRNILDQETKQGAGTVVMMEQTKATREISRMLLWIIVFSGFGIVATIIAYNL